VSIRKNAMSNPPTSEATGVGTGGVKILPRLEGFTLLLGMILLCQVWGGSWWVLAILFLAPYLSFLACLTDARTSARRLRHRQGASGNAPAQG
jgi:hypothetical protein